MKNRRYLRAFLFDAKGKLLPPLMKSPKVSTALLPIMKLPGMKIYAGDLVEQAHGRRHQAALDTLVTAQKGRYCVIYGVALVCCPDRRHSAHTSRLHGRPVALTLNNSFLGSFAAIGSSNQIWAGDVIRETLADIEQHLQACVEHIRTGKADERMFAHVAM